MEDIYGMLIVLGLLIVISQCVNKEKQLFEGLVNSNVGNIGVGANSNATAPIANTNYKPTPSNNNAAKANNNANKQGRPSALIVNNNLPQGELYKTGSNYLAYNPGRLLFADANAPYGFKIPQSMQQEYALLKDLGISKDNVLSQKEVPAGYARFLPTGSQYPGFDANAKGGFLEGQAGKHVENARNVANSLQRNAQVNGNANANVVPANLNAQAANSNVPANANVPMPNANPNYNSLINRDVINPNANANAKANANSGGSKGMNLFMIHTTWCGHSKRAFPDFKKLMDEYDGQTMNGYLLNIKEYDADKNKDIAKKYGVRGFPSYVGEVTNNGKPSGDKMDVNTRSYDGLLTFLKENTK